jgi:hypothetical protein
MINVDAHKKSASLIRIESANQIVSFLYLEAIRPALLRGGANAEGRLHRLSSP